MRIFNWVHRRFIPKANGLTSHQKLRKDDDGEEPGMLLADTKALLDHHDLDGWNGAAAAILSIGTFGLLKDEIGCTLVQEFGFQDNKEEEVNPELEVGGDRKMSKAEEDGKDDIEGDWKPLLCDNNNSTSTTTSTATSTDHDIGGSNHDEDIANKKKERTTLADLFSAESHDDDVEDDGDQQQNCSSSSNNKLPANAPIDGLLLFARKKKNCNIPAAGFKEQDSRPIQKLHGLMKRMLKRKIHPDTTHVEPKIKPTHCCSHPDFPVTT